ncbi:MAG TPA: glycosyltransferase family 4 protein [Acidimicrobiales bacterium]|nr:glycosyltransferase family 4 protein [Acidimicrobiales bacterium]
MRILMVSQFYAPVMGGVERAVENMSVALARRGHQVSIATLSRDQPPSVVDEHGVRVHRIGGTFQRAAKLFSDPQRPHLPPVPDPEAVRALRRVIDEERPDVVHVHDWFVHSLIGALRHRDVPIVMSVHDHSLVCANKRLMQGDAPCSGPGWRKCLRCATAQYGPVKGPTTALALRLRRRTVERTVDRFAPVSSSVARHSRLDASGVPVTVLPNFIPEHDAGCAAGARRPDGLPPGEFVVFVGDATPDKGIDVLLAAHRRLDARPPVVVVGRPLAESLDPVPEGVVVLGMRPHDEVLAIMRAAVAIVVPSRCAETFGLVALEAMSAGTVVIAARIGALDELVVHEVTGLLVPPGDADALGAALRRVLDDPAARDRMAVAGRERARDYREAVVVDALERAYRATISDLGPTHARDAMGR